MLYTIRSTETDFHKRLHNFPYIIGCTQFALHNKYVLCNEPDKPLLLLTHIQTNSAKLFQTLFSRFSLASVVLN